MGRQKLTNRVVGLLSLFLLSASCGGKDQLHGMFDVNFPSTAVCLAQHQSINFRNSTGEEILIEGARISYGTDALSNFSLVGITVGDEEILSVSGTLSDVHIPTGTNYSFQVLYTPRVENSSNTAILDIAYSAPEEGVIQAQLTGTSAGRSSSCPSDGGGGGPVTLEGDLSFRVTKMVAATNLTSGTIDTDQGMAPGFQPIDLSITLEIAEGTGTVTIHALTGDSFQLPPPDPLRAPSDIAGAGINNPTIVRIANEATGSYDPSTGSLLVEDVLVEMIGDFKAKLKVSLTTEIYKNDIGVNKDALSNIGRLYDTVTKELHGQRINTADQNSVILIGFAKPFDVVAAGGSLAAMEGSSMAVVIYGNIIDPTP